ncbi:aryldialkylphosphatase [Actinomadura logoneensis]|uniref:Aryldialkylphosphatase n=1 Tax=Actinomadura logoneensis TaxID=2293572 RepID=A0A372JCY4_9ACTN|nr:aryldialkylphosphatase [Actinomadura logoneensis]RFU37873.1 aryldialkylphosphatase [Actinomadura logoneensis]
MTPSEQAGRLRTVTGAIDASSVTGPVLAHEHLQLDLRWPTHPRQLDSDPRRWLDEEKTVTGELGALRVEHGVGLVVDLTCSGAGRNAATLSRMAAGARVAVIASTGVFAGPFHPSHVDDADEVRLAERLLAEIGFGLDGTSALPGVIGEVGTWGETPTEAEERCLRAAARAAAYSGLSVAAHGRSGLALLEVLTSAGLAPGRVALTRQDLGDDPAALRKIADSGAYVSFSMLPFDPDAPTPPLEARIRPVLELLDAGHADRVMLSSGVSRMTHVTRYDGPGYGHLFTSVVPALRTAGADDATLELILHANPLAWLTASD